MTELRTKINQVILGRPDLNNMNTSIEQPEQGENSYLGWMNKHATGTRGWSRFSHWYHGDSGIKRARDLLEIANQPDANYEDVLHQLQQTFKESSYHKHSLSRYLVAQFSKQDFINLERINDDEFYEMKSDFKFN